MIHMKKTQEIVNSEGAYTYEIRRNASKTLDTWSDSSWYKKVQTRASDEDYDFIFSFKMNSLWSYKRF